MNQDNRIREALAIIDSWFNYFTFIKKVPCASLGIIKDGKLIFNKSYGYKNLETKEKASKNESYRIASISKLFTTISILQLVEKNKINLDDPVVKHLEWFNSSTDNNLKNITIRHLLFHCSGLTRENDSNHWCNDKFPTKEEIKRYISGNPTSYAPLEKWKYSNLGFSILGLIIEKVSGVNYQEYVKIEIIKKLELTFTEPDLTEESKKHLVTGYTRDFPNKERKAFNHTQTKDFAAATGFISNVEDLSKFIVAFFNNSSLLKDLSKKEMKRIQWEKDANTKWGLGLEITKNHNAVVYGHGGNFQGYSSSLGYTPDLNLGVIVLANCIDCPATLFMNSVFSIIAEMINNYDSLSANKEVDLSKYEGRFESRWGDMDIRKVNKKLIMYYLDTLNPFENVNILEHKEKDTFKIVQGDGYGQIGEEVQFIFNNGNISKVIVGSFELEPLNIQR